jgi:TraE protein
MSSLKTMIAKKLKPYLEPLSNNLKRKVNEMLTAMDKGVEAAQVATPPVGVYKGVDLRILPKFVAFKAAMLKERLTLQYILAIHLVAFTANFAVSRFEIMGLEKRLRAKEYILAPGVVDFTTVSPQSVSDSYVVNAAMSFLALLGNVNAANIDEQYKRLTAFMAPELGVQFSAEAREWLDTVKAENISEILRVTDREIVATEEGFYKVTALATRERYSNSESMGRVDEVIEMTLKLVPPVKGKEWYLEITNLKRTRADGFKRQDPKQTQTPKTANQ